MDAPVGFHQLPDIAVQVLGTPLRTMRRWGTGNGCHGNRLGGCGARWVSGWPLGCGPSGEGGDTENRARNWSRTSSFSHNEFLVIRMVAQSDQLTSSPQHTREVTHHFPLLKCWKGTEEQFKEFCLKSCIGGFEWIFINLSKSAAVSLWTDISQNNLKPP